MELFNLLFLLLVLLTFSRQKNNDAFGLRTMNVVKGIAIMGVFVGHASKEFLGVALYKLLCYVGLFSVSVFFFVSGYGLMYGAIHKKDYRKGFLSKRIFPIVICYFVTCALQWITDGFSCFSLKEVLLCDYTPFAWYIFSIIWLYLMFYLAMLITKRPIYIIMITATLLSIYAYTCYSLLGQLKGAVAMVTFVIGSCTAYWHNEGCNWLRGAVLAVLCIIFMLLYGVQLTDKYIHYPNILTRAYEPIVSYIFPFMAFGFMQRLAIKRFEAIWDFFQRHSLQIYLLHGIVMYRMIEWVKLPSEILVFLIFGVIVIFAVILNGITNIIKKVVS